MIFDSLGIGEMGVVLALAVVLIEPKKLGKVMKEFAKFKKKALQIQNEIKSQLDAINLEEEAKEKHELLQSDKASMRAWGRERVSMMTSELRAVAATDIVAKIKAWPSYQHAKCVACFVGTINEIDTEPLLKQILADHKILLLPFIGEDKTNAKKVMHMAEIKNLETDLVEGAFGIQEPKLTLRKNEIASSQSTDAGSAGSGQSLEAVSTPSPDVIFVPGTCFDLRGGRIGQGLGFYDRYLPEQRGVKVGIGFEVQMSQKNLTLDPHDQMMDVLISEHRLTVFSAKAATHENVS